MDDVVERLRKDGMEIEDARLRRMGPVHFGHINFRGTFRFGSAANGGPEGVIPVYVQVIPVQDQGWYLYEPVL